MKKDYLFEKVFIIMGCACLVFLFFVKDNGSNPDLVFFRKLTSLVAGVGLLLIGSLGKRVWNFFHPKK